MQDDAGADGPPMPLDKALQTISALAERGGPRREDYELVWRACSGFGFAKSVGHINEEEHRDFMASLGPAGTVESLMGHIFHKPYGYAGDFEIIEKIYRNHRSEHPMVTRWDEFVQAVPSSQSVRNRGPHLLGVIREMLAKREPACGLRIVSLGSGPGRDVEHALRGLSHGAWSDVCVQVTCIDMDPRALAHSTAVLGRFGDTVRHVQADVIRLRLDEPVDLIWSSGLFDYFSDRTFSSVLARLLGSVPPDGRIVVGNFSERCAGHGPMSLVNWQLVVRSRDQLFSLASAAGVHPNKARVDAEATGLNLFLTLER